MTKDLQTVINRLLVHINKAPSEFLKYTEEELRRKPAPNKWSKKELLGHLIDSAANNHHRFVKAQFMPSPFFLERYMQDDWVRIQNYNEKDTHSLINLWKVYNEHILFIMQNTPDKNLEIKLVAQDPFEQADNLYFLMKDYVDHMDHHFGQIFG